MKFGSELVEVTMFAIWGPTEPQSPLRKEAQSGDWHWHLCWKCEKPWKHERPVNVSHEKYEAAHMCPDCGAGPWSIRYGSEREARSKLARGPSFSDIIDGVEEKKARGKKNGNGSSKPGRSKKPRRKETYTQRERREDLRG